jgi:hypothetical protein
MRGRFFQEPFYSHHFAYYIAFYSVRYTVHLPYKFYYVKYYAINFALLERFYYVKIPLFYMPLLSEGTFKLEAKSKSGRIHVPAELVRDSQFPLKEGSVIIEIEEDKLIISRRA